MKPMRRRATKWWRYCGCLCLWPGPRWSLLHYSGGGKLVLLPRAPCSHDLIQLTGVDNFHRIPVPNYFVIVTLRSIFQHHRLCMPCDWHNIFIILNTLEKIFFPIWFGVVFKGKLTVFMALRSVSSVIVFHWRMFLQSSFPSNLPGQWLFFSNLKLPFIVL